MMFTMTSEFHGSLREDSFHEEYKKKLNRNSITNFEQTFLQKKSSLNVCYNRDFKFRITGLRGIAERCGGGGELQRRAHGRFVNLWLINEGKPYVCSSLPC